MSTYHTLPHHCHQSSHFPHHKGSYWECSGFCCRIDENSPPCTLCILLHPSGPDSEAHHHTPGSSQCTSFHGHTGTGLQRTDCIMIFYYVHINVSLGLRLVVHTSVSLQTHRPSYCIHIRLFVTVQLICWYKYHLAVWASVTIRDFNPKFHS